MRSLFLTLVFTCIFSLLFSQSSEINYGFNDEVGQYLEVGENTRLYYEIYGEGNPVLLLHGGVYGYINEFEFFIDALSETHQVICLGTRGHVKSDIGHEPFSFDQRAEDAVKLLDHLNLKKTIVIGFSDGGYGAFKLAAGFPEYVQKMVVIGAADRIESEVTPADYSEEGLMETAGAYFKGRVESMPEPDRWGESLSMLNTLYNTHFVSKETFEKIEAPILLLAGEFDEYSNVQSLMRAHEYLPISFLSVIPMCGHVVFYCNWDATWASVKPFIYTTDF